MDERVVITKIHKDDAFYKDRADIVGKTGDASNMWKHKGWYSGEFICDVDIMGSRPTVFYKIKFKNAED